MNRTRLVNCLSAALAVLCGACAESSLEPAPPPRHQALNVNFEEPA
jgi:hypothetical protein